MQKSYLGVAGWSYADWEGVVYPEKKPRGFSELAYLAQYLDAMEVNVTFYRPITPAMSARWLKQVESKPDFLFTAKLLQRFTHDREHPHTAAEVAQFKDGLRPLLEAERFGALLMQFPWSFPAQEESFRWLAKVGEEFREFPKVVEVRHASWDSDAARDFLLRHDLGFCNIDQPHTRNSLGETSVATGPVAYYRFHGRNYQAWFDKDAGRDDRYNYLYAAQELSPWAEQIAEMEKRVQRLFVMNNNHYRGQAVVNALEMKSMLTHEKVLVPAPLRAHYPDLDAIAAPVNKQPALF